MDSSNHLHILWTNADPLTAEKMVFMYAVNSLIHGWWKEVTLIVWGAPAKLVSENPSVQEMIREALDVGVHITACKACADQLGVTQDLIDLKIDVKYWGQPLTMILKNAEPLLTV
jgi:hypothetical protein